MGMPIVVLVTPLSPNTEAMVPRSGRSLLRRHLKNGQRESAPLLTGPSTSWVLPAKASTDKQIVGKMIFLLVNIVAMVPRSGLGSWGP